MAFSKQEARTIKRGNGEVQMPEGFIEGGNIPETSITQSIKFGECQSDYESEYIDSLGHILSQTNQTLSGLDEIRRTVNILRETIIGPKMCGNKVEERKAVDGVIPNIITNNNDVLISIGELLSELKFLEKSLIG